MDSSEIKNGLLILHGYNAGLKVWNRQLVCKYGTADQSGELTLGKADTPNRLRHIVIISGNGLLTLQALRWLCDAGISLTVIESNGRVLLSQGNGNFPFAKLARRQALAVYQNSGLQAARWMMIEKLRGQAENLDALSISSTRVRDEIKFISEAGTVEELITHEARAAGYYWNSLESTSLNFVRKDQKRIPRRCFNLGSRFSPISKRAMHAATPGQAIINYCYAVVESLCAIELTAVGLNPEVGITHTDTDSRRSMALDLMETIRPDADRLIFQYFHHQIFRKSDFWETERGSVRLGLDVRKAVIRNTFLLESQARDHAMHLRDLISGYQASNIKRRSVKMGDLEILPVCEYCGATLPRRPGTVVRRVCADCREIQRTGYLSAGNAAGFTWTESALAKHSKTSHEKQQEKLKWEAQFSEAELPEVIQRERQRFVLDIFPRLQAISVTQISKQVGISLRYASLIKKGLNVPHPCLYGKFGDLLRSAAS
jgi:CRISPR-associated endonuclease Cas1